MPLPDLSSLPPWALFIFAVSVAIIFAFVYLGIGQGKRTKGQGGSQTVELAMATIDNSGLREVAVAIEALNLTIMEQNKAYRDHSAAIIKEMGELRDELRHQGEAVARNSSHPIRK